MLKQLAKSALVKSGLTPHRKVDDERMRGLLARLHPQRTDLELIRLGGEGDGGYLVPDDLQGLAACFSPGVDVTASFEAAMIERGVPCFLADASVSAPPFDDPLIDFIPRFLGAVNNDLTTTLDAWVAQKAPDPTSGDLLLQMDIEGHEWTVLLNASEQVLKRFRIIVLELHDLPHCYDPLAWRMVDAVLERLSHHFHFVHAHPNGFRQALMIGDMEIPYLLEVTLLRKDRAESLGPETQFPHPLDRTNVPAEPDVILPACLRGNAH